MNWVDLKEEIERMSKAEQEEPVQVSVNVALDKDGVPYDAGYVADFVMHDVGAEAMPVLWCSFMNDENGNNDEWEEDL